MNLKEVTPEDVYCVYLALNRNMVTNSQVTIKAGKFSTTLVTMKISGR